METWATFSIIDHRKPVYRQALAMFDRIVVPIPKKPIGDQTQEELDQLSAEVEYLQKAKAAEPYFWNRSEFELYRQPYLAEALAQKAENDLYLDTRLMLSDHVSSPNVLAIPVYGGQSQLAESREGIPQINEALTIEIMQRLPVPEYDTPLEDLVRLRETPAFRTALEDLLEWKRDKAPGIFLHEDRGRAIQAAMADFDRLTKAYAESMSAEGHKKLGTIGSIFFSLMTGEPLGALKETLVSFRETREPTWKKVSAMKCAPGAMVYHFQEAIGS
jgi:hypothetical protein